MTTRVRDDRLSAHDYFRTALDVLGEVGSEGMTIAVLCSRLAVTKGSFYHHFGGLSGFVEQLLAYWETEHNDRLIASSKAQPDIARRFHNLTEIAVGLPHASEAAIRAWARSNGEVAEVVLRVDRRRERHLTEAIAAVGIERVRARTLARMAMNLLIGAQARESRVDTRRLRQLFEEYDRLVFLDADPALVGGVERT